MFEGGGGEQPVARRAPGPSMRNGSMILDGVARLDRPAAMVSTPTGLPP